MVITSLRACWHLAGTGLSCHAHLNQRYHPFECIVLKMGLFPPSVDSDSFVRDRTKTDIIVTWRLTPARNWLCQGSVFNARCDICAPTKETSCLSSASWSTEPRRCKQGCNNHIDHLHYTTLDVTVTRLVHSKCVKPFFFSFRRQLNLVHHCIAFCTFKYTDIQLWKCTASVFRFLHLLKPCSVAVRDIYILCWGCYQLSKTFFEKIWLSMFLFNQS